MALDPASPWTQAAPGRCVLLASSEGRVPAAPRSWLEVRVDAASVQGGLAPLVLARRRALDRVGARESVGERARWRVRHGLRRRLLGEERRLPPGPALLEVLGRLSQHSELPVALVVERADRADPDTRAWLERAARGVGSWAVALVLGAGAEAAWTEELASALDGPADPGTVQWATSPETPSVAAGDLEAGEGPAADPPPAEETAAEGEETEAQGMTPEALVSLRAAAVVGDRFEPALVAALLGLPRLRVLEHLQQAREAGWRLDEDDAGCLHLAPEAAALLRAGLLPALAKAWNERLAELLAGVRTDEEGVVATDPPRDRGPAPADDEPGRPVAEAVGAASAAAEPAEGEAPELRRRTAPPTTPHLPPHSRPQPVAEDVPFRERPRARATWDRGAATPDAREARAAGHLEAAGHAEAALQRWLEAAEQAAENGAFAQSLAHTRAAEGLLARLPPLPRLAPLARQLQLHQARLAWAVAGQGSDLQDALGLAAAARDALDPVAEAALHAEARGLVAGIAYDIGDPVHLELALSELTEAVRVLQAAGEHRAAARLLNDQAAVWVRIGDPVRAAHLLDQSRQVFASLEAEDPRDRAELAETLLLLARLPFHVQAREGQERAALRRALEHAQEARAVFAELDDPRHAARASETAGRLALRLGEGAGAIRHLEQALVLQRRLGDVLGLARTSDALAAALVARGEAEAGLGLLSESVRLNAAAGSVRGLAYNRRTLGELAQALGAAATPLHREALARVEARIAQARADLDLRP